MRGKRERIRSKSWALKAEAVRRKDHDEEGRGEGRGGIEGDEEEAFARSRSEKVVAELESRVKALRAL